MKAVRIERAGFVESAIDGAVLAHNIRDASGRIVFAKARVLRPDDGDRLCGLAWSELHVVIPDAGDLHELEAGERLARAAAGAGVSVSRTAGGHWSLAAAHRGLAEIRERALAAVNAIEGLAVYSLVDGQVVDAGEDVGGAKIIPFVIGGDAVAGAEAIAGGSGLVSVRPFAPVRVAAIVQESLGASALDRFRSALSEKVAWFGSTLGEPRCVAPDATALTDALRAAVDEGAHVVVVAGSSAMDPLEPAFDALRRLGGSMHRHGVPVHPGSLLWLGRLSSIPVLGMPSCGLFSRATVFDLVLPRLLAGAAVDPAWFASLGHGGLLTRDTGSRFPPYRASHARGEVE